MKKLLLSAPRVAARILASVWLLALLLSAVLLAPSSALAVPPAVSAGGNHTGALKPDGSLWGWGSNSWGQLGVESLDPLDVPTAVLNGSPFVKQAKGFEHTVAIKADGTLWAWGRNYEGQFGNGTTLPSLQPVLISGFDAPVGSLLAAGERHTLLLKPDGSLWAWGWNAYGQLGDGTQINRSSPVQVQLPADSPVGDKWLAIAAGYKFSLAIRDSDKKLFAWGYNFEGQLGDGTKFNRASPVAVDSPNAWTQVAAGAGHVLAIDAAGQIWSWGSDAYGEMGDDSTTDGSLTPVVLPTVSSELWTKVAAGGQHSGAINADGSLWMWGSNNFGQIGDGDGGIGVTQTFPVQVGADIDWIDLACGDAHTVGLRDNNNLLNWGNNGAGQVGSQLILGTGAVLDPTLIIANITDVTPPFLTIDVFSYLTSLASQNIAGTVEATGNPVEIWLNGIFQDNATLDLSDPLNPRWTFPLSGLVAGTNTVVARTLDASSNPTEKSVEIILDEVKPTVSMALSFLTNQLVTRVAGTFSEDRLIGEVSISSGTIACIDNMVINGSAWECLVDGLVAGDNPFSVIAVDFAGNASDPAVSTVIVDQIPPSPPVVSGTAFYNTNYRPTWNWTTSGGGNLTFRYSLDGVSYVETSSTSFTPATDFAEGSYTLFVQERDAAGNWSLAGLFETVIDTTAPVVAITSPVAGSSTKAPVLVYSAEDAVGSGVKTIEVRIDGVLQDPFIASGSSLLLADGSHLVEVRAMDFAGNISVGSSVVFTVDTVAPYLADLGGNVVTNAPDFLIIGQAEPGTSVLVRPLPGTEATAAFFPFQEDTWFFNLTDLAEGPTLVTVIAEDAAGNQTQDSFTIIHDSTLPFVTVAPVTSPTNLTTQTLTGAMESNAMVTVTVDTTATVGAVTYPTATTWSCDLSDLAAGANALTITVTDLAGNPGNTVNANIYLAGMEVRQVVIDGSSRTLPAITMPMANPVLIAGPPTAKDAEAGVVRVVRNPLANSFDLRFAEWRTPTGAHGSEDLTCLLLEVGRYTMPDGAIWEVGTFPLAGNNVQAKTFTSSFPAAPALFLTLQTENDNLPVSLRVKNVGSSGFDVSMTHGEASLSIAHLEETVGYLAIYTPPTTTGEAVFGTLNLPYLVQKTAALSEVWSSVSSRVLRLEEETTLDAETAHAVETIHVLTIGQGVFAQVASIVESDPVAIRQQTAAPLSPVEFGSLQLSSSNWVRIPFGQTFATIPVVVVKPLAKTVGKSGFVQLRNISTTDFEVRYSEWDGGVPSVVAAYYLAAEPGRQTYGGLQLEAGTTPLANVLTGSFSNATAVSFSSAISGAPLLFAALQTVNDVVDPVISRLISVTSAGFSVGMQEPRSGDGSHVGETVGWIAMQQGRGQLADGRILNAFFSRVAAASSTLNFADLVSSSYASALVSPQFSRLFPNVTKALGQGSFTSQVQGRTPILLADMVTAHDTDPAVVRYANLSNIGVDLSIEEEPSLSGDTAHQAEDVSVLLLQ